MPHPTRGMCPSRLVPVRGAPEEASDRERTGIFLFRFRHLNLIVSLILPFGGWRFTVMDLDRSSVTRRGRPVVGATSSGRTPEGGRKIVRSPTPRSAPGMAGTAVGNRKLSGIMQLLTHHS